MNNTFGEIFKITTFGESHGEMIGVVVDGCPAGLSISLAAIEQALAKRRPGNNTYTSPRAETDEVRIVSGLFEGRTTGQPITLLIANQDADSSKYELLKNKLRPGHANFTYLEKYGIFDHRGGGRASARETAARVAAGSIAQQLLQYHGIHAQAYLQQVATHQAVRQYDLEQLESSLASSELFCPCAEVEQSIKQEISQAKTEGDSLAGIVAFVTSKLPIGLGDPVYQKLEAKLAAAMLSIPASKGFEIGEGFDVVKLKGSQNNDQYAANKQLQTNHAGGTLGGISNGQPLYGRVAFKPTSSIAQTQQSVDLNGQAVAYQLPTGSRHDPCVAIRAVPVVQAMLQLVLADCLLKNRLSQLEYGQA